MRGGTDQSGGERAALHTLRDCFAVRPTRERLDWGGFSIAFVRTPGSRKVVNISCGRKRRRRCALPAQSMTLVGGRPEIRNPSPTDHRRRDHGQCSNKIEA